MAEQQRSARSWLPAYLVLALIWGCSFVFMKVGLDALTPAGIGATRLTLGFLTLAVISLATRTPFPPRAAWAPLTIAALVSTAIPWTLFAFSEERISSALASIINGVTPLATLIAILIAFPEEKPNRQRIAGLVIGFLGVLVVVGVWRPMEGGSLVGIAACIVAISLYGTSYPYVRRRLTGGESSLQLNPLTLATGLMLLGSIQGWILVAIFGFSTGPFTGPVVWSMLALGVLGSGVAYLLNYTVVRNADATTASTVTYVITLVAVSLGAIVLHEELSWNEPVGALVVIIGAATAQGLLHPDRWRRGAA